MPFDAQNLAIEAAMLRAPSERDIAQALPTELVQSCFRLLDFRTRISVSHVSRAWRAIALNDGFLWNEAPAPYTNCHHGAEMLDILLARSDPLPFSFSWETPYLRVFLPAKTADVVFNNMHRMQKLHIKDLSIDDRDRLLLLPAPLLRTFRCEDTKGTPVHPEIWHALEDLRIVSLSFTAAPQPFAAVRIFCCWDIDHFVNNDISVFSVFPAVKTLRIGTIIEEDFPCLSDWPGAMDEISLGELDALETDYAPLLRSFDGLRVTKLHLHMTQEAACVVEQFSVTAKGLWRMAIDEHASGLCAELRDEAQDRTWTFTCDVRISFAREPRLAACVGRLEALSCSITLLVELHNLDGWIRSLPELRTIKLQLLRQGGTLDSIPALRSTAPISLPLLDSLTLWMDGMTGKIKQLIETRLPELLPVILERVPRVIIDVLDVLTVHRCDLGPLTAVAAEVHVVLRTPAKTMHYELGDDFA